jgi:hypothetical protein
MGNSAEDFKKASSHQLRDRIKTHVSTAQFGAYWVDKPPASPPVKYASGSLARCVDELHPRTDLAFKQIRDTSIRKPLRSIDYGGPLAIEKAELSMPARVDIVQKPLPNTVRGYKGVYFPSVQYKIWMQDAAQGRLPFLPAGLGTDSASLSTYGAKAIKNSLPDVPDFSLFRFLGELREGLPKVPLKTLAKEKKFRNVGGEYLNYQFGIAPTISDLEKLVRVLSNQNARKEIKRQLGLQYRVRKVLDKDSSTTRRSMTLAERSSVEGLTGNSGTITVKNEFRIWSSVVFGYAQLSELDRLFDEFDRATLKLGVLPTAIDIYNLIPWSWLVDWFINLNDVMTNLSFLGKDGLFLHRGYLMATYTSSEVHEQSGTILGTFARTSGEVKFTRKYRIRASPFGFGLTWKEFSPFQTSILLALGSNRMRF